MSNWTPGVKADATKVVDLLTDRYTNPTKDAIRKWVIAELKAAEPNLVLDLWGGGRSAAEMAAAGLNVLSVDDGRSFGEFGITKPRGKRAMTLRGEADGYRTGWGSVVKYLPECDAAWLDFMGHLAPETERTLRACADLKVLAVTLMAERMAGVERLSVETWIAMYAGALENLSGLRTRSIRKYRRPGGQWVLVFLASRVGAFLGGRAALSTAERRALEVAQENSRRHQDDVRAKANASARKWRATNREDARRRSREWMRARKADPMIAERMRARNRVTSAARYASDPLVREKKAAYHARRVAERLAVDPIPPCANCGSPRPSRRGSYCPRQECQQAHQAAYQANPERRASAHARAAAAYAGHVEERKVYNAAYREDHREELAAYDIARKASHRETTRAWRESHREEWRARKRAHYAAHREDVLAYQSALRARKKAERQAEGAA